MLISSPFSCLLCPSKRPHSEESLFSQEDWLSKKAINIILSIVQTNYVTRYEILPPTQIDKGIKAANPNSFDIESRSPWHKGRYNLYHQFQFSLKIHGSQVADMICPCWFTRRTTHYVNIIVCGSCFQIKMFCQRFIFL